MKCHTHTTSYLSEFITEKTKKVVLAHLSEHNNTPEKALEEYEKIFKKHQKQAPKVEIAKQNERLEMIEI